MERVGSMVRNYSTAPGLDLVNIYELTLFCFLTGNNDMHLKNFSLINTANWILAPAYDLLNVTIANPSDREEIALSIEGKKSNLKKQNFINLGIKYGLNNRQIENAWLRVLEPMEAYLNMTDASFLNQINKENYKELLRKRAQVLQA